MATVFFGYYFGFKKFLTNYNSDLAFYRFYKIYYFMFIPIFWEKKVGLFNSLKKDYFEIDEKLENRLLKISKIATAQTYQRCIEDYLKEQHEKTLSYEKNKKELKQKQDNEFISFIKIMGLILLILIVLVIIKTWMVKF